MAAGNKPSGLYAERMLKNAWPKSDPEDLYDLQRQWEDLRDQAHDTYQAMRANCKQLMEALDSPGFDALHADRALVTRNYEFLADVRNNAAKIWGRGAELSQALRYSMTTTVEFVQQQISEIEDSPLIDEDEKQTLIDALVEDTNIQLIGESTTAAEEFSGMIAEHIAYSEALPWHMSTADSSTYPQNSGSGVHMMGAGNAHGPMPLAPAPPPAPPGQGTGGGRQAPPGTPPAQPPSQGTDGGGQQATPGSPPAQPPSQGTGGKKPPEPSAPSGPAPGQATGGEISAPGFAMPGIPMTGTGLGGSGFSGGGGVGGGGLHAGGLFAPPPQGLMPPSQLLSGLPPTPAAATGSPLSAVPAAAPGVGGGGGVPNAAPPLPASAAPAAQNVPAAVAAQPGVTPVQPAGLASPPASSVPQAVAGGSPAMAGGPLPPAPPLPTPPPVPPGTAAAVPPVAPPIPPPPPTTPFHGALPVAGAPQISSAGTVERAEDPEIVRAKQLLWECLWEGRRYSNLAWAVGLHRSPNGSIFYLTSSEGFPYIPRYVYLPDSPALTTVFADNEFVPLGRAVVLAGWQDPARIILSHHRLRADAGASTLWAIVSTTRLDPGARGALPKDVRLVEIDPDLEKNPLYDPAKATDIPELLAGRQHRLAIADRGLWPLIADVRKRWQAALDLVGIADQATRERSTFTGLTVTGATVPVTDQHAGMLADAIERLQRRERLDDTAIRAMRTAYMTITMNAQGRRHTPQEFTDDTGYVDAYRRARAWEAAIILTEAVNTYGNKVLPDTILADIAYCALTAHTPHTPNPVYDVLRYYA